MEIFNIDPSTIPKDLKDYKRIISKAMWNFIWIVGIYA